MTPETAAAVALMSQKGLLIGYTVVWLVAMIAGAQVNRLRPLAFAVGFLSATHAVYYVLFLIYPDVLDAQETMLFSIVLRYQVLFTAVLVMAMGIARGRWRN